MGLLGESETCELSPLARFLPAGDAEEGRSTRDEIRLSSSSALLAVLNRDGDGEAI